MVGKDGNLYFAHLLTEDSRDDYTCNVQYLATRTILAKEPTTLTVNPCESHSTSAYRHIFYSNDLEECSRNVSFGTVHEPIRDLKIMQVLR